MVIATGAGALAAIASAVAAGFSVLAAFRQEEATYESQLYNKQVDTISALIRSVQNNVKEIGDAHEHFLAIRPE